MEMEVMRTIVKEDPDNLKRDQATLSADPKLAVNVYWAKFAPLKPSTDSIIDSIQSYLNIKK
jgi:hypothetical protein